LLRAAPCDEIHLANPPLTEAIKKVGWVRKIALIAEATDIRDMGLHRRRIKVGPHQHLEARLLKAEAQTASTAENLGP
jgi:hypothetical protein